MFKKMQIVKILKASLTLDNDEHLAEMLEIPNWKKGETPNPDMVAMIVDKTYTKNGHLIYVIEQEGDYFMVWSDAVELMPEVSKEDVYKWFYEEFSSQVGNVAQMFRFKQRMNPPEGM